MKPRYTILRGYDLRAIEALANAMIEDGYEPCGGILREDLGLGGWFYQAMWLQKAPRVKA